MTVSTETNKVSYIGNGIATTFAIPFPFLEKEHLKVRQLLNDVQTERTDWTVSGGNMVFETAPANDAQIVIMREVPLTQETDYRENEILPAETLERNFDKLTMQVQQLKEQADRAVTVDLFSQSIPSEFIGKLETLYSKKENITAVAEKINQVNDCSEALALITAAPDNASMAQSAKNAAALSAANAENSETAAASSAAQALLAAQTAQKYIGETVFSLLPIAAAGYHLLDGSLISGQGVYADFVNYIASLVPDYPNLFVQEAAWQNSVASFGVCGKFVYDANAGTVRLPKVTGFVEGTLDASALGDLVQAGLPNISGSVVASTATQGILLNPTGAFFNKTGTTKGTFNAGASGSDFIDTLGFNASRSSSIYGSSNTVQPQSIKGFMYIVIAASVKSTVQADIDNLMSGVNALVSTLSSNKYVTETYKNGLFWYRVWSDGWIEQGGIVAMPTIGWYPVTFLKPFSDTNYTVVGSQSDISTASVFTNSECIVSRTSSAMMHISIFNSTGSLAWRACGF